MKYEFVKTEVCESRVARVAFRQPSMRRGEAKKLRDELSDCLVQMAQEWKEQTSLEEACTMTVACIEQAATEGLSQEEIVRMLTTVRGIPNRLELERYIYNYKLRASGLSVHRIIRGK